MLRSAGTSWYKAAWTLCIFYAPLGTLVYYVVVHRRRQSRTGVER